MKKLRNLATFRYDFVSICTRLHLNQWWWMRVTWPLANLIAPPSGFSFRFSSVAPAPYSCKLPVLLPQVSIISLSSLYSEFSFFSSFFWRHTSLLSVALVDVSPQLYKRQQACSRQFTSCFRDDRLARSRECSECVSSCRVGFLSSINWNVIGQTGESAKQLTTS